MGIAVNPLHVCGVVYWVAFLLGGLDMATASQAHDTVGAVDHGAVYGGRGDGGAMLGFARSSPSGVSVVILQGLYRHLGSLFLIMYGR